MEGAGLLVHGSTAVFHAAARDLEAQPAAAPGGMAPAPVRSANECREVSRGARVYVGGLAAAVAALNKGEGQPLDYRLFVGRKVRAKDALEREVKQGLWQCAVCARPVALKQCLALPKPLWHEVMELLGGEAEMLSRFKLVQRTDLDSDEDDTDGEAAEAAGSGSEETARTKAARRAAVEVQNKEKETTKRLTWLEAATRGRDGREKREEERGGEGDIEW